MSNIEDDFSHAIAYSDSGSNTLLNFNELCLVYSRLLRAVSKRFPPSEEDLQKRFLVQSDYTGLSSKIFQSNNVPYIPSFEVHQEHLCKAGVDIIAPEDYQAKLRLGFQEKLELVGCRFHVISSLIKMELVPRSSTPTKFQVQFHKGWIDADFVGKNIFANVSSHNPERVWREFQFESKRGDRFLQMAIDYLPTHALQHSFHYDLTRWMDYESFVLETLFKIFLVEHADVKLEWDAIRMGENESISEFTLYDFLTRYMYRFEDWLLTTKNLKKALDMNTLMGLVDCASPEETKLEGWAKKYLCKTTLGSVVDGKFKFKCLCGEETTIKKMGWGKKKEVWAACAGENDPLLIKVEDMNLLMVKDGVDIKNLEFYVPFCIRRHFELFNLEKEKTKKKAFKDFMKGQDRNYCLNERGFGGLGLTIDRNIRSSTFGCLLASCWVCSKAYKQGPLVVNNLSQNAHVFYTSAEIQSNPKMKAQIKENIKVLEERALRLTYLQDDANANHLDLVEDEDEDEIVIEPPKIEKKERKKINKVPPTFDEEEDDADDEETLPFDDIRDKGLKRSPAKIPDYFKSKLIKKA